MGDEPDYWTWEEMKDNNGNIITYADKWSASDSAGKREMLKEWKITARWEDIDGKRYPRVRMYPLSEDSTLAAEISQPR